MRSCGLQFGRYVTFFDVQSKLLILGEVVSVIAGFISGGTRGYFAPLEFSLGLGGTLLPLDLVYTP